MKKIVTIILALTATLALSAFAQNETVTYDFPADVISEDSVDMQGFEVTNGFHTGLWFGRLSTTCTHGHPVAYKLSELSLDGCRSASFALACKYINEESALNVEAVYENGEKYNVSYSITSMELERYTVNLPQTDARLTEFSIGIDSVRPGGEMYDVELDFLKFHKGENIMMLSIGGDAVFNGEKITPDAPAVIKDGSTLTPARFVAERFGAEVAWDKNERKVTITKDDTKIELVIDSKTAYVNGEAKELSVPAQIINDRTFTPARFVAEALGATVDWDGQSKTVIIDK